MKCFHGGERIPSYSYIFRLMTIPLDHYEALQYLISAIKLSFRSPFSVSLLSAILLYVPTNLFSVTGSHDDEYARFMLP